MGFGLNITDTTLQEPDKKDWVSYNGIMMPRNTARAKKAWDTMNSRGHKSKQEPYGIRDKKKQILDVIKKYIQESGDENNNIISLETSEYNLPKMLPEFNFFIAQNDKKEYLKMIEHKPKNVKMLYYGDVSDFYIVGKRIDYAFLDFCCTFENAKQTIIDLRNQLADCKMIFITVCLRRNNKNIDDYKFDFSNKIFDILPRFRFSREAVSYRDKEHPPMITFFLKNIEDELIDFRCRSEYMHDYGYNDEGERRLHDNPYEGDLCRWVKDKIEKEYPKLYQKIDNEKNHEFYCDGEDVKIFFKIYNEAIEERELYLPRFEQNVNHQNRSRFSINDCDSMFLYFCRTIEFQVPYIWDKKHAGQG